MRLLRGRPPPALYDNYDHKRYQVQPTKDEVEQTACVEFPPWRKRGSDFIWDPEN